ncbi:hypothetical protein GW17_00045693 [Ensete ventricosum]|nr:hypothetical protein GW17_00045693 [Ensete ventricosum]
MRALRRFSISNLDETIAHHPHRKSLAPACSRLYRVVQTCTRQLGKRRAVSNGVELDRLVYACTLRPG